MKAQEMHSLCGCAATISCIASRSALIVGAKSTDKVGFPFGCPEQLQRPRVVHSLFKEYHSCARSFSPLAPPSLSPLARRKRLTTPLLPLRIRPLPLLRTPLSPPTLLPLPPTLPPTPLLRPLTPRLPLLRTPLLLLRMLPRRCNLRLTAKDQGAGGQPPRPFLLPALRARGEDLFKRSIKLPLHCRQCLGTLPS